MGNHTIDCDFCGEDTRGLSGVRGCHTQAEADKCYTYNKDRQRPKEVKPHTFKDATLSFRDTVLISTEKSAFETPGQQAAYIRGAEAMRQRCADHLRQRAEEEARRSRMITSAACSRLSQEVTEMNIVVPVRAEDW